MDRYIHTSGIVNNEDPDDVKSWLCSACTLPIFSTPFESRGKLLLHDVCTNLPDELMDEIFHPRVRLVLKENQNSSSCSRCTRECGSMMYECPEDNCGFILDLLCALQITIRHRSHNLCRLIAISGSASFVCGACGTQHPGFSRLSYMCKGCDFWIHPECASLPNAITSQCHQHALYLDFNLRHSIFNYSATPSRVNIIVKQYTCGICGRVSRWSGGYFCAKCNFYAHIKCAVSDQHGFKPVLIRDAKLAGLRHLPMADEKSSVMRYLMEDGSVNDHEVDHQHIHPHPLIFHDQEEEDTGDQSCHVCNACVQLISSSDPFYMCSVCPDFLLHTFCVNLPTKISETHSLYPKAPTSCVSGIFICNHCDKMSNGFAYSAGEGSIDVVCAMMPPLITHHLHGKSHILYKQNLGGAIVFGSDCICCGGPLWMDGRTNYRCGQCRDFQIHASCALLPISYKHKFDEHRLKLTTKPEAQRFCEICEKDISTMYWCYSCGQCDQWFHCSCIHGLSNVKFGGTIRVDCHDCPLTFVTPNSVIGYRCNYCLEVFRPGSVVRELTGTWGEQVSTIIEREEPAYECSRCYFRIHDGCAEKCLLKIQELA